MIAFIATSFCKAHMNKAHLYMTFLLSQSTSCVSLLAYLLAALLHWQDRRPVRWSEKHLIWSSSTCLHFFPYYFEILALTLTASDPADPYQPAHDQLLIPRNGEGQKERAAGWTKAFSIYCLSLEPDKIDLICYVKKAFLVTREKEALEMSEKRKSIIDFL